MVGVLTALARRSTSAVDPAASSMRNACPPPARESSRSRAWLASAPTATVKKRARERGERPAQALGELVAA